MRIDDPPVLDAEIVEPVDPRLKLGPVGAAEGHVIQPCAELGEALVLGGPIVLMDAKQGAVVQLPYQVVEAGVGVFVEYRFGLE